MSDLREAAKLALIALENGTSPNLWVSTKENLRKALAQPDEVLAEREACAKAAEAVLEAWGWDWSEPRNEALRERMEALRQALAQPEEKMHIEGNGKLTTKPYPDGYESEQQFRKALAQPEWVGLTDEELLIAYGWIPAPGAPDWILNGAKEELLGALRKVEAKLKEKNT